MFFTLSSGNLKSEHLIPKIQASYFYLSKRNILICDELMFGQQKRRSKYFSVGRFAVGSLMRPFVNKFHFRGLRWRKKLK